MKKDGGEKRRHICLAAAAAATALTVICCVLVATFSSVSSVSARYSVSDTYEEIAIMGTHEGHETDWTDINNDMSPNSNGAYTLSSSGSYYLSEDLEGDLYISASNSAVTLCLNGCMLKGKNSSTTKGSVIYVSSKNCTLNICDCGGGEFVRRYYKLAETTGGKEGETLFYYDFSVTDDEVQRGDYEGYIVGGLICGGHATGGSGTTFYGGGVTLYGDGDTLNMFGGTIAGNISDYGGGGVTMNSSGQRQFYMFNGEISGNCSRCYSTSSSDSNTLHAGGGGGVALARGTFEMYDGTIANNYSYYGGGVNIYSSDTTYASAFNMSGGTISGNHAVRGAGVYVNSLPGSGIKNVSFTLSGDGSVEGNVGECLGTSTSPRGAGVYVESDNSYFSATGGKISGNVQKYLSTTDSYVGAGVFVVSCADKGFTLSGDAYIYGNFKQPQDDEETRAACDVGNVLSPTSTTPNYLPYLDGALSSGALVGVSWNEYSSTQPTAESPVQITYADTASANIERLDASVGRFVSNEGFGIRVNEEGGYLELYPLGE